MSTDDPRTSGRAQETAEQLRRMIYDAGPGDRIGSLRSIAEGLGVGIVSVQQAARVLEHEGLLEVRRGPNGGYYGSRPDAASVERAVEAYLRTNPVGWEEVLDCTSLLFTELVVAAASNRDEPAKSNLLEFKVRVHECTGPDMVGKLEQEFQDILFGLVDRPLFELLTRVALRFAEDRAGNSSHLAAIDTDAWKDGRTRIIDAILKEDQELARFEAHRNNRRLILDSIGRSGR